MNSFHLLAPMEKQAMPLVRTAGGVVKSLLNKSVWRGAAKVGEKMITRGGTAGKIGKGIVGTSKVMPYLGAYGLAGMVAPALGVNLPGSELAFNIGAPAWSLLTAGPNAIRTARLASGKYDAEIEGDIREGASQAGRNFLTAMQHDKAVASDPKAYGDFMEANGLSQQGARDYMQQPKAGPGLWDRMSNVFTDPTANVIPVVRQRVYDQLQKEAMVKAMKDAYGIARAVTPGVRGLITSALPAAASAAAHNAPLVGKYVRHLPSAGQLGTAMGLGFIGMGANDLYKSVTDKPYDVERVQQEGLDAAQAGITKKLGNLSWLQRQALKIDPTLAFDGLEQNMPGVISSWEAENGQPLQRGWMGKIQQAWQHPKSYSYDAGGNRHYV